jgi:hypothetical protein
MTGRPNIALVVESHHFVFDYLGSRFADDIKYYLTEKPRSARLSFFQRKGTDVNVSITRESLRDYLCVLETNMKGILSKHSPFFWMFLYRRIKPALDPAHDNTVDELTTHLVRNIVDLAITKFGNLSISSDMRRASQMTSGQCWGGYLAKAIEDLPAEAKDEVLKKLESSDAFLPFSFKSTNYRDIFEVEGLAYDYWLATARLRAIGKGSRLFFNKETGEFAYEPDPALDQAIERFDERLGSTKFFTTLIGVTLSAQDEDEASHTLLMLE